MSDPLCCFGDLVEGEVPRGIFLLEGPPGVGKSLFAKIFTYNSLVNGEAGVFLATEEPPDQLVDSFKRLKIDISPFQGKGMINIIDCYSWREGRGNGYPYIIDNPSNITDIRYMIDKARNTLSRPESIFFIIDSLTTLTLNTGPTICERFIQMIAARLRSVGSRGVIILEAGVHDTRFIAYLRSILDGVFEMRLEEDDELRRFFRIYSLKEAPHSTRWVEFKVSPEGLRIVSNKG